MAKHFGDYLEGLLYGWVEVMNVAMLPDLWLYNHIML